MSTGTFIGSGINNSCGAGSLSSVVSGQSNTANGFSSFVGSGVSNISDGHASFIGSGLENITGSTGNVICGGSRNTIDSASLNSSIVGGVDNTLSFYDVSFHTYLHLEITLHQSLHAL